jgi:hypothetical protein
VAVGEDVGPDLDGLADDALDRRAAAVDLRPDLLDDDAAFAGGLARAGLRLDGERPLGGEDAHCVRREGHGFARPDARRRFARGAVLEGTKIAAAAREERACLQGHRRAG